MPDLDELIPEQLEELKRLRDEYNRDPVVFRDRYKMALLLMSDKLIAAVPLARGELKALREKMRLIRDELSGKIEMAIDISETGTFECEPSITVDSAKRLRDLISE